MVKIRIEWSVTLLATALTVISAMGVTACGGDSSGKDKGRVGKPASSDEAAVQLKSGPQKNEALPILMYHVINSPPAGAKYTDLYVSVADFKGQMKALKRLGYDAVTLNQAYRSWHGGPGLPQKPIVISFDDGTAGIYRNALPILNSLGWPAVLNLEAQNLKPSWGIKPYMVKELVKSKWEIDSHTINHLDLTTLPPEKLRYELVESKKTIKSKFSQPANFFCYPAGRYNETVERAVKDAGYLGATTTQLGLASPNSDPYALPRVRIGGSDGVDGLVAKIRQLQS